jgi:heparin binding hemagglutinin HbhA
MSTNPEQPENNENNQTNAQKGASDLAAELREMAQQIETAFRTAIESDRAKQLQQDLTNGFRELSSNVKSTIDSLQEDPHVKQAEQRGREVLEQARDSKVLQDLQETIVNGISQLNEQLRKLIEKIETNNNVTINKQQNQDIPIEQEPATGETTRLREE